MYIPDNFNEKREEELVEFIRKNSFALFITVIDGSPVATHVPVELEQSSPGKYVLKGHIARANPQSDSILTCMESLMIFQGPHAYVSSGWYNHLNVPTWNYMAVHAYGKLRLLSDEDLYDSLSKLVDRHEAGQEKRISVKRMPVDFLSKMMKQVTGFEMSIDRLQGNFKLSQNRNDADYKNIIAHLEKSGETNAQDVAEEMKKIKNKK